MKVVAGLLLALVGVLALMVRNRLGKETSTDSDADDASTIILIRECLGQGWEHFAALVSVLVEYYYIPLLVLLSVPAPILLHMLVPLVLCFLRDGLPTDTSEHKDKDMVSYIFAKVFIEVFLLIFTFMVACPLMFVLIVARMVWIWYAMWYNPINYVFQAVILLGMAYEWVSFAMAIPNFIAWITQKDNFV